MLPKLKTQELPDNHPESCVSFLKNPTKPIRATSPAVAAYQVETILARLHILQEETKKRDGIHRVQVFEAHENQEPLCILYGPNGAITAMLQSEYAP